MRRILITTLFAAALGGSLLFAAGGAKAASTPNLADTAIIDVAGDMGQIRLARGFLHLREQLLHNLYLGRRGDAYALRELGFSYSKGWGVIRDLTKAYMWFTLAGMQGSQDALENRDTIAARMSAEQIARAKTMAQRWLKTYEWEVEFGF